MQPEILLIDKPKGITSFDVIRRLRKKLGIRKMGHGGTLDPGATGLMIIGVEKGTKKLNEYLKLDKIYEADVLLGVSTTTGDMEGTVLEERGMGEEERGRITDILPSVLNDLVGEIELPVSIYSAIKKDGVELYKRARRGEQVEAPIRKMKIYWIELVNFCHFFPDLVGVNSVKSLKPDHNFYGEMDSCLRRNDRQELPVVKIRLKVASGTYIRSIAEEIGRRLGYPATVKELRRVQIGEFRVEDAEEV